jgi:hypothetical protein
VRVIGTARRAERTQDLPLHGRHVRRLQADDRAQLVKGGGIARPRRDLCLRQLQRTGGVAVEARRELGRRLAQCDVLAGNAAEIVVHGHRAARERNHQPRDHRQAALGCRVGRVGLHRRFHLARRRLVVEVIGEVERPRPQARRLLAGGSSGRQRQRQQQKHGRNGSHVPQWTESSVTGSR